MRGTLGGVFTVLLAIVGVATATVVLGSPNTSGIIKNTLDGTAGLLRAAEAK